MSTPSKASEPSERPAPSQYTQASQLADADDAHFQSAGQRLSAAALADLAKLLPDWQLTADCLTSMADGHPQRVDQPRHACATLSRQYRLSDFSSALARANAIGLLAEAINHHPELSIAWGKLDVSWSSHDAGGLTIKDFIAAARCDRLENA